VNIVVDDVTGREMVALLHAHRQSMFAHSPPESVHALDLDDLRRPDITMWSAWDDGELLGCGALKALDATHGEVKSMRTATSHLRKGVARAILERIIAEARARRYARLSLETGSAAAFEPPRRLYAAYGFTPCGPFGDYVEDPYSVFMTRRLPDP
jgi:putative acetyltransferase